MAERLLGCQKGLNGAAGRTIIEPQRVQASFPSPGAFRKSRASAASMIVSSCRPRSSSAFSGKGRDQAQEPSARSLRDDGSLAAETQQASVISVPRVEAEAKPESRSPRRQKSGKAGEEVPFQHRHRWVDSSLPGASSPSATRLTLRPAVWDFGMEPPPRRDPATRLHRPRTRPAGPICASS